MIRLITFDVTGTLMRHRGSAGEQYAKALEKHFNIVCCKASLEKSFKECYQKHVHKSPLFGLKQGLSSKKWWSSVFFSTVACANIPISKQCLIKTSHESGIPLWIISNNCPQYSVFERSFNDVYWNFEWEPLGDAKKVLHFIHSDWKYLSKEKVVVGVISNNDKRVGYFLEKAGLGEYIDFVVTSHESGFEKPDPQIFQEAKTRANELLSEKMPLDIGEVIHIGDSPEKDYFGAVSAGCKALLLDPTGAHAQSGKYDPIHCISDLNGVIKFLKTVTW